MTPARIIAVGCITLVFIGATVPLSHRQGERLVVSFLDVGQGDAIAVRLPDDTMILIDGGRDNAVLAELGRAMPWWKRSIEYVIATHADKDHYAGLRGALEKYEVGTLFVNGEQGSEQYHELLSYARERHVPIRTVLQGDELTLARGVAFRFIWPPPGYRANGDNGRSLVSLLTWGSSSFLFTADITRAEEVKLIAALPDFAVDVLKVGHHGSNSSSDSRFLAVLEPRFCVISAGRDNPYGHPHAAVLSRLRAAGCRIISTGDAGSIRFTSARQVEPHFVPSALDNF